MLKNSQGSWQTLKESVPISEATWQTLEAATPAPLKSLIRPLVPRVAQLLDGLNRRVRGRQPETAHSKDLFAHRGAATLTAEQLKFWDDNGYLVLPRFFGQYRLDEINALSEKIWTERNRPDNQLVIDALIGTPEGRRMYFRDAPDHAREYCYKLNDAYLDLELIRELILEPRLCQVLAELLDGDPIVCNSLNFERGSEQAFHCDSFYMPAPVGDKMLATWIALEDAHLDAGPLHYYSGSHKIPPYLFSHGGRRAVDSEMPEFQKYIDKELAQRMLKPELFVAQAGDVLIWHSQLYHGGSAIHDTRRTRKSLVTHYFRATDMPQSENVAMGPGRYYWRRPHQLVP